jgi:Protein of unknown function (DUF2721)
LDVPTNPFAVLTFISAPAVLTNASCVLLFGTGNRYGRAVDRMHELADTVGKDTGLAEPELRLRIRQLEAGETRTLLIVRALTCFYAAVSSFVASTLVSLIGALLVSARVDRGVPFSFGLAGVTGAAGVFAMMAGALILARETIFSFRVLKEEKKFLAGRIQERLAQSFSGAVPARPASS